MPLALTAPGVYIQELPSGSRSITGVSTSITAFVGRARRGPVEQPTSVFSFDEFERRFGGLWTESPLSQAVRQYFLNGGSEALIVRVINRNVASGDAAAASELVLPVASARATLRATAEAMQIPGLHHFVVTAADAGAGTYTLQITAVDATGTTINADGADYDATSAAIDPGTTDLQAAIAATVTGHTTAVQLMELAGDAMAVAPDFGPVQSRTDAGQHFATLSATDSMLLRATANATAILGFARLEITVRATTGTNYELDVAALDGSGVTQAAHTITGLDSSAPGAIAAALAASNGGSPFVELVGSPMTAQPTEGLYVSRTAGANEELNLAVGLRLEAADAGAWGNGIRAEVEVLDAATGAFHLQLSEVDDDGNPVAEEVFLNLTMGSSDARSVQRVLELESRIARVTGVLPSSPPAYSGGARAFAGGEDGLAPRLVEDLQGSPAAKSGLHALRDADLFNLLCLPLSAQQEDTAATPTLTGLWSEAAALCEELRSFLIVDAPRRWRSFEDALAEAPSLSPRSKNAALYFPRVLAPDPLQEGRLVEFPPCGVLAGIYARTDAGRGVWKAPAGTEAVLRGVPQLALKLTDAQQGKLNPLGINCLRSFPVFGQVSWGSRTLDGADVMASQWKHVPVRRLALFLEETLFRSTRWAVFEPNDEPLWAQLRSSIRAFMHGLFRQGAFAGASAREAYLVKCDKETTPPEDVARGIVNVIIGFAPLQPAEFVIVKLQQLAGQRQ
ncbi:MAG: phage tail sheath C-terminal domain-containing protein [Nannocystaceae bacterium]